MARDSSTSLCCPICYESLVETAVGDSRSNVFASAEHVQDSNPSIQSALASSSSSTMVSSSVCLEGCGHKFCKNCIKGWFLHIEKIENSKIDPSRFISRFWPTPAEAAQRQQQQQAQQERSTGSNAISNDDDVEEGNHRISPTCPHCRHKVTHADVQNVLGRDLQYITSDNDVNELDYLGILTARLDNEAEQEELTMAYLEQEDSQQCPDCRMWIIRSDGCDFLMCLCGCRFCWCCGERGCCYGGPAQFYDNKLRQHEAGDGLVWDSDDDEWLEYVSECIPLFVEREGYYLEYWEGYTCEYDEYTGEFAQILDRSIIPLFGGKVNEYDVNWYKIWCEQ
jgi:hypothetical protein